MKEMDSSIRQFAAGSLWIAALLAWLAAAPVNADQEAVSLGCIVRSIELDPRAGESLLSIRIEGAPASLGARLDAEGGVALDLAGCAPAPGLAGQSFAEGLVSGVQLVHDAEAPGLDTAIVVRTRGPFEYSVSSTPGAVLVVLSSRAVPTAQAPAQPERRLVRVLEPLPLPSEPPPDPAGPESPVAPAPPLAEPEQATTAIARAVLEWAQAWSEQRVDDYLAAYASDFRPPRNLSRPDWEAQRRLQLTAPAFIDINLNALQVRVIEPGRANAGFLQSYLSNSFSDQVYKSLTLIEEDGSWKILHEQSGQPPATEPE